MPVYKKASARGQLQPQRPPEDEAYEDDDDNAVTRFQRRSPLPGPSIAARIADGGRARNRSIDDEAMTVLLDRASLFPPASRANGTRGAKSAPAAAKAPIAPITPVAPRVHAAPSEPAPTLTRPRMAMPARTSRATPPPVPAARPSAPAPAVTISQPPATASGARPRAATDTLRTRRQGSPRWRVLGALAVLIAGGGAGAAITSLVARSRATIAAEPAPAVPARAMELPLPTADAKAIGAACAVGDLTSAAADRADARPAATGPGSRHGAHRSPGEASAARRTAGLATPLLDAGADAEPVAQDDFAAATEALSKAKLETTLP